jgi:hypothetical protein
MSELRAKLVSVIGEPAGHKGWQRELQVGRFDLGKAAAVGRSSAITQQSSGIAAVPRRREGTAETSTWRPAPGSVFWQGGRVRVPNGSASDSIDGRAAPE